MLQSIDCAGMTDRGRKRETNQDHYLIADLVKTMQVLECSLPLHPHSVLSGASQGRLLLVADGMGGHAGGEQASALAIETLNAYVLGTMRWFYRFDHQRESDFEDDLKSAVTLCHDTIKAASEQVIDLHGMGTTVTMAYLFWPRVYIVHAGDSRAYLHRNDKLEQITTDHTMEQYLAEQGALKPEEIGKTRWSHMLWNVVGGTGDGPQPAIYKCDLHEGDSLLLCSDGLSGYVSDDEISAKLDSPNAKQACENLIEAANKNGGGDNITTVVARFVGVEGEDSIFDHSATEVDPFADTQLF